LFVGETRVLVDGYQFLRPAGTGIASYVRTLAATLKSCGCSVSVLYGQRFKPNAKKSPGAAASAVFSHEISERKPLQDIAEDVSVVLGLATGSSFRAKAHVVDASHIDLRAIEPPLPICDHILNANRLFARASKAFNLSGRFTEIANQAGDLKFAAAHWTAPISVKMRGVPNIYTLHDLVPLQFPYFVMGYGDRMHELHEIIARQSDHIITVSEASKRHIIEILKVPEEHVTVTYQPVKQLPNVDRDDAERVVEKIYGVRPGQYALFLGAIEPKKNLKRLIEAFVLARLEIPLLLAGPLGWLYDDDIDLINRVNRAQQTASVGAAETSLQVLAAVHGATSPIRLLGYLPSRHIVALLKCAKFFVFPSIYEGFGLPVVEAMQLGVPVLTSNNSSLAEITGDAALQVNPFEVVELTDGLRKIDADADLRAELARLGPIQASRFSVDHCQRKLARAYQKIGIALSPRVAPTGTDACSTNALTFTEAVI
jgi:glycosyltransferase involved in cell wall biosynthesis